MNGKTKKIRFIEPQGRPGRPLNAWIKQMPLLGPITLATILKERGYDVAVYNENISGPLMKHPTAYADFCSADLVGISIMTPTANRGYQIASQIHHDSPGVRIALGGVHATMQPHEAIRYGDLVVRGEAESIIEAIAGGEIAGGIVDGAPLENLDLIPTLDHGLMLDFEKLISLARRRESFQLPLMTSRGCPYGCKFCSVTRMFGRKVRRQSIEKVYRDICRYADQGFRQLFFYDDNFTADRDMTLALLERLASLNLRFNAQARVDFAWADNGRKGLDKTLLHAMRRAGVDVLYIGYETIDDTIARQWRKGYQGGSSLLEKLREDTKILHDIGAWIHGMFVLGPDQTKKDSENMLRFALENGIESFHMSILTPFPGTPLFKEMYPHLIFRDFPSDWDYYDGTHCLYDNSRLGLLGMQFALLKAHESFYSLQRMGLGLSRVLFKHKSQSFSKLAELWHSAQVGRNILRQWQEETVQFLELARTRIAI